MSNIKYKLILININKIGKIELIWRLLLKLWIFKLIIIIAKINKIVIAPAYIIIINIEIKLWFQVKIIKAESTKEKINQNRLYIMLRHWRVINIEINNIDVKIKWINSIQFLE